MSNYWGSNISFDPSDMERMFTQEDTFGGFSVNEELTPERALRMEEVRCLLDQLPPREADFIELYFFNRVRQTSIAELYNVSQPTVCYRLQRGVARLRYLFDLPKHDLQKLETDLRLVLTDEQDIRIMVGMVRTTCQSDVANELGISQGKVRYRFLRTITKLEAMTGMGEYVKVFRYVSENLNMLKNTSRASWSEPTIFSIC